MNDCKYDKELCISMPCVDLHFFIKIYICCEEIDNDYKSIVIFDYDLDFSLCLMFLKAGPSIRSTSIFYYIYMCSDVHYICCSLFSLIFNGLSFHLCHV